MPLHSTRLFQRRYNQADLFAQAVHAAGGLEVAADWLVPRGGALCKVISGGSARKQRPSGVTDAARRSVAGKHVVVVDE